MSSSQVAVLAEGLAAAPVPVDLAELVDELRALEILKCAAEARQARLAVALAGQERDRRSVAAQVGLARRVSPYRGQQLVGLATVLARELPHTRAAFEAGRISEWRAMIIARETACLPLEHRQHIDEVVAGDAGVLEGRGDRELAGLVRRLAAQADAASVAARRRRAESERRISLRPAPDTMVYLTALLPVAQGVAVYAALRAAAVAAVGVGEASGVGSAMADELVRRATGAATASGQRVALNLTMSVGALLAGADDPARLADFGPVPAELARGLVADSFAAGHRVWLKRLFTEPGSGALVAMDSRARQFPKALAEFIGLRDQFCRTPWCNARIRHRDHVVAHEDGGPTSALNGQGLCEACNYTKQAPGWQARPSPGPRHTVTITTPTGHQYRSTAPEP